MADSTGHQYRILDTRPGDDAVLIVDLQDYELSQVTTTGYEEPLATIVAGIRPGYIVEATISWHADQPRFESLTLEDPTLFTFSRGVTGLFEVALDTWEEARHKHRGVNSRVTYSNDGDPNGALYTFANQPGERDIFTEFQHGDRPLEPLLDQIENQPPYEVFIFDPATHEFVLVYIVLGKHSILADTIRDTYDCPRPTEPLLEDISTVTDVSSSGRQGEDIDLWDLHDE